MMLKNSIHTVYQEPYIGSLWLDVADPAATACSSCPKALRGSIPPHAQVARQGQPCDGQLASGLLLSH